MGFWVTYVVVVALGPAAGCEGFLDGIRKLHALGLLATGSCFTDI